VAFPLTGYDGFVSGCNADRRALRSESSSLIRSIANWSLIDRISRSHRSIFLSISTHV
jgi:hypothetical protein